jgi:hypothetical protein
MWLFFSYDYMFKNGLILLLVTKTVPCYFFKNRQHDVFLAG